MSFTHSKISSAKGKRISNKACGAVHEIPIYLWEYSAPISHIFAVMLTAVAAPTPTPAYTNIYITLNELELGSRMYIA